MKKLLYSVGLGALLSVTSLFADTATISLPGTGLGTATNLLYQGPIRLLSISVTANTNAFLKFFDSPYVTNTIDVAAFTNITRTLGVVSNVYTTPFGVTHTNFYTNAITSTTNTVTGGSRVRETIYSSTFLSNTVANVNFGAGKYLAGGFLITNIPIATVTPVILSIEYEKLEP